MSYLEIIAQSEPSDSGQKVTAEPWAADWRDEASWELERTRKIYRARTVAMLRRYMRYSLETGETAFAAGAGIVPGEGDVVHGGYVRGSGDLCA